jgi:hypothetical protein
MIGAAGSTPNPKSPRNLYAREGVGKRRENKGAKNWCQLWRRLDRKQLENMDPRGLKHCIDQLGMHSENGAAMTHARCRCAFHRSSRNSKKAMPALVMHSDEDWPPSPPLFLKRTISSTALGTLPKEHIITLEASTLFNGLLGRFFTTLRARQGGFATCASDTPRCSRRKRSAKMRPQNERRAPSKASVTRVRFGVKAIAMRNFQYFWLRRET